MDYSELVTAIEEHDAPKIDKLLKDLIPRLIRFLRSHMNAGKQDAEDCAQEAFLAALETIRNGGVHDPDHILSFLLTTSRNTYLNLINKKKAQPVENIQKEYGRQPRQLFELLDKERRKMLAWCLDQLSDDYRRFIDYWFSFPGADASGAALEFGITTGNAWTRKHRIIKKLNTCCEKKNII